MYDPLETAWRLRILRTYLGYGDSQTRFAEDYGFTVAHWNNLERGHPLPRDAAIQLVRRIPRLSLDWLFFSKPDYLPVIMRLELEEAERRVEPPRPKRSKQAS
jgi:transcriptional regulator with XRE-family HTH domain